MTPSDDGIFVGAEQNTCTMNGTDVSTVDRTSLTHQSSSLDVKIREKTKSRKIPKRIFVLKITDDRLSAALNIAINIAK